MKDWDPKNYMRFADERTRPAYDLAARVPLEKADSAVDIGCGPGNSTAAVRARYPMARVTGMDNSPAMIGKARSAYPDCEWILADASSWTADREYDLVFSSAALQWVGDYGRTLPRLLGALRPGGVLAVQVPANGASPIHAGLKELTASPEFKGRFAHEPAMPDYIEPGPVLDIVAPYASALDVWVTEYCHLLEDHRALIAWYETTGMRPALEALDSDAARAELKNALLERCRLDYKSLKDGRVIYPFRRLFFIVTVK